ncbi:hypothetical protein COXBURSA331_A0584 [Coxiella burnetii RSA 331]|nr:hypothetical protein COXBURSA331_A0584 [Coxiella burnetii RSA 331]
MNFACAGNPQQWRPKGSSAWLPFGNFIAPVSGASAKDFFF